jgi:hypothetical protein
MEQIAHSGRKSCTLEGELKEGLVRASAVEGAPPEADMSASVTQAKCKVSLRKGHSATALSGEDREKATVTRFLSPNLGLRA